MPTPRKGRKSMKNVYSLESFAAQMDEDGKNSSIQIYTDSKERIPTADEEEDNPFVTKKGKSKAKANGASKARKVDAKTARMEEGVDQDEGMIYMLYVFEIAAHLDITNFDAAAERRPFASSTMAHHRMAQKKSPSFLKMKSVVKLVRYLIVPSRAHPSSRDFSSKRRSSS